MKKWGIVVCMFVFLSAKAQDIQQRLEAQVKILVADTQMRAGILGLYVADAITGQAIYQWNGSMGLAPASTQKIITSVAAFDLLGKDYRYNTTIGYKGNVRNGILYGSLQITGAGDPTFGSWRYDNTRPDSIKKYVLAAFKNKGIDRFASPIFIDGNKYEYQPTPGGWIWDDIGNYYGAGSWALNWRENQFDLVLQPGRKEGDPVKIKGTRPALESSVELRNLLITGKKGSGDNGYIYLPAYSTSGFVEGTVPAGEDSFVLSGALPHPPMQFGNELLRWFDADACINTPYVSNSTLDNSDSLQPLFTHTSPPLDSIVYWFMKRSINLYGENLLKTIAAEQTGVGSTDSGVAFIRRFYTKKGIDPATIKIIDGSGLSPSNRVTAEALCRILLYAQQQKWISAFQATFPRYNNMSLKSGTIRGVKSYAGYHTSTDGKQYVVAIIVNNFDGRAGDIEKKMFRVLDVLK